jgi:osmoprotectant transport system ATP-binding protein
MREGRIAQAGTPDSLLVTPADAFVESFVGEDRALRRLALTEVGTVAVPGEAKNAPSVAAETSLKDALALLLSTGADQLTVTGSGAPAILTLAAIRDTASPRT